jgi:hypothetical protein
MTDYNNITDGLKVKLKLVYETRVVLISSGGTHSILSGYRSFLRTDFRVFLCSFHTNAAIVPSDKTSPPPSKCLPTDIFYISS